MSRRFIFNPAPSVNSLFSVKPDLTEILWLVNGIFYAVHIVVFSTLGYKQGKANGVKSVILILIFLLVLFFVSIQVGGFIAQIFFIGKEMTSK